MFLTRRVVKFPWKRVRINSLESNKIILNINHTFISCREHNKKNFSSVPFSANKAKYLNNEKIIIQRSLKCLLNRCNNYRNEIAFANLNSISKYRESLKSSFELFQNPCTSFATLSVLRRKLLLPINFINISAENIASFHFHPRTFRRSLLPL